MMKRYAALLLTAALVTSLTACNWDKNMDSSSSGELSSSSGSGMERSMPMNGDQLLENRSLQLIIEDIQAEFETGGIYQPGQVTDTVLRDRYGLTTDQVADYYGYYSTADGYSDNLLAVEAKPGQIDSVKKTLEKYREDLMTAMEKSGIGYAYDRAKNMQIITRGNYAFLVAVNSLEADSATVPLFDSENKLVTEIINKSFA